MFWSSEPRFDLASHGAVEVVLIEVVLID